MPNKTIIFSLLGTYYTEGLMFYFCYLTVFIFKIFSSLKISIMNSWGLTVPSLGELSLPKTAQHTKTGKYSFKRGNTSLPIPIFEEPWRTRWGYQADYCLLRSITQQQTSSYSRAVFVIIVEFIIYLHSQRSPPSEYMHTLPQASPSSVLFLNPQQ